MKKIWRLVSIWIVFAFILSMATPVAAQGTGSEYFSETGHWVSGDFLVKYRSVADPVKVFGYPLTEAFRATGSSGVEGMMVQYFNKAVFVLFNEGTTAQRVELFNLGEKLLAFDGRGAATTTPPGAACSANPAWPAQTCYAFLDFFNANGGETVFGYPISAILNVNGRLVQYFQNARFEWRPEMPSGQRVVLTNLGEIYLQRNEDPSRRMAVTPGSIPQDLGTPVPTPTVIDLQVRAFPVYAIAASSGTQTVFVIAQDQQLRPIKGATVRLVVRDQRGGVTEYLLPPTNELGVSSGSFAITGQPIGLVEVLATVVYGTLEKTTITSYRIWW